MNTLLGSSPITSMIGYAVAVVGVAITLIQQGGVPQNTQGWLMFAGSLLLGLAGRFAHDAKPAA